MKRIMHLLLGLSALLTSGAPLAGKIIEQHTTEERQLEQKKLAIMKELTEAGSTSAYILLAKIGENRPLVTPTSQNQLLEWYVSAAQTGNSDALLWLGHFFLHGQGSSEKDSAKNGLYLLASASILGNLKATDDLVLIPKILRVSYDQVEEAFFVSINSLSKGQVINCSWIRCNPDIPKILKSVTVKAEMFRNDWQHSRTDSIYEYIRQIDVEKLLAQSDDLTKLRAANRIQNAGKIAKIARLEKQKQLEDNPDWELGTYLDRIKIRQSSAQKSLKHYKNQDFLTLEKDIRRTIDLINFHRDPGAQIDYDEVLQNMGINP